MSDDTAQTRNFRVMLTQAVCIDASRHVANSHLVLPYIYVLLGGPVFVAGLLFPLTQLGRLATPIAMLPLIHAAASRKRIIGAALIGKAAVLGAIGLAAESLTVTLIVAIFLLAALTIGVVQGINSIAYNDLVGRLFPRDMRQKMLYRKAALAGGAAFVIAVALGAGAAASQGLERDLLLLSIAAVLTIVGAILIVLVREAPAATPAAHDAPASGKGTSTGQTSARRRQGFRQQVAETLRHDWFRRLLVASLMLLSIELAMPFYAIHAATGAETHIGNISLFVVATSLAAVIGGYVWPRLSSDCEHVALSGAALLGAAAAALTIAIELIDGLRHPAVYAVVFFAVAMAIEGVTTARMLFVLAHTSHDDRSGFLAVGNVIVGGAALPVALALGYVAHVHGAIWPVLAIGAVNLIGAAYCVRLHEAPRDEL